MYHLVFPVVPWRYKATGDHMKRSVTPCFTPATFLLWFTLKSYQFHPEQVVGGAQYQKKDGQSEQLACEHIKALSK